MIVQKTVLLTLGRLPKALDIAKGLHEAGCRVIIAEPFSWHLSRVSRFVSKSYKVTAPNEDQAAYLDDLLQVIEKENVELVIPISEEALHATLLETSLPEGVAIYSSGQSVLRELHDKWRFVNLAKKLDLSVPDTALLGSAAAQDISERSDYITKPVCTCSGQGLEFHAAGSLPPDDANLPATVLQQQMKGALKSTFSIVHEGRVIDTIVYQAAILSGTVAVAFERLDDEAEIVSWIADFSEKTSFTGFLAFDFMEDDWGVPHAIECNPRVTSGIHFVDSADLANAILNPETQFGLKLKPYVFMKQFWPALTEVQIAMFKKDDFFRKLKLLLSAKEVNFSWSDPLPVWLMPFTSYEIMRLAFVKGESFGEAATHDIGWYEAEPAVIGKHESILAI